MAGCQSKKIDHSMLVGPMDPVSFSQDILPLLTRSCSGSGCHIGQTTNGVNLSSYAQVKSSQGFQYGGAIVVDSSSSTSPLVNKIKSESPQFGSRMPLGRNPLSSVDIAMIEAWINDGAKDN